MELSIQKLSKAFNQKVIFANLDLEIPTGARLAISGSNGAGKSTLLKILSGGALPNSGRIQYRHRGQSIHEERLFRYVHFVAPYNSVIEELTLPELFAMHHDLGALYQFADYSSWVQRLDYPFKKSAIIKTYSSGMKQRIKLGLTLLDDRPLILLDEPTSNLDAAGKSWFYSLLQQLSADQTLIIATNDDGEKAYCNTEINIEKYSG